MEKITLNSGNLLNQLKRLVEFPSNIPHANLTQFGQNFDEYFSQLSYSQLLELANQVAEVFQPHFQSLIQTERFRETPYPPELIKLFNKRISALLLKPTQISEEEVASIAEALHLQYAYDFSDCWRQVPDLYANDPNIPRSLKPNMRPIDQITNLIAISELEFAKDNRFLMMFLSNDAQANAAGEIIRTILQQFPNVNYSVEEKRQIMEDLKKQAEELTSIENARLAEINGDEETSGKVKALQLKRTEQLQSLEHWVENDFPAASTLSNLDMAKIVNDSPYWSFRELLFKNSDDYHAEDDYQSKMEDFSTLQWVFRLYQKKENPALKEFKQKFPKLGDTTIGHTFKDITLVIQDLRSYLPELSAQHEGTNEFLQACMLELAAGITRHQDEPGQIVVDYFQPMMTSSILFFPPNFSKKFFGEKHMPAYAGINSGPLGHESIVTEYKIMCLKQKSLDANTDTFPVPAGLVSGTHQEVLYRLNQETDGYELTACIMIPDDQLNSIDPDALQGVIKQMNDSLRLDFEGIAQGVEIKTPQITKLALFVFNDEDQLIPVATLEQGNRKISLSNSMIRSQSSWL